VAGPTVLSAPTNGIWRVGRGANPLVIPPPPGDLVSTTAGNRFDSDTGSFGILYFGSNLEVCFGETLARFRPSPRLLAELELHDEWRELGFMEIGSVPFEWRQRRSAARVVLPTDARFLDVESARTHAHLRRELAVGISALGYDDLDVAMIRGRDRRVSRLIADWAFRQSNELGELVYSGIRYLSRVNSDWECWAVFHDIDLEEVETIPITLEMPELQKVANLFELAVF
jgi:hypothetical protein